MITPERLQAITSRYPHLRIAVIGDFCLDRYLEIDPSKAEISIETGLPVHNVVRVRAQPGGAGTVVSNLAALGIGTIFPVGFHGVDGEGFELKRALSALPGVRIEHFYETPDRRTFTYCKPLLLSSGSAPTELSRLDSKNWTPTPGQVSGAIIGAIRDLRSKVDAVIALEQVDIPETGVITTPVREALACFKRIPVIGDSRRGLADYPPVILKMNIAEFRRFSASGESASINEITAAAEKLCNDRGLPVFVTLAEHGIVGAVPKRPAVHMPALPVRGEIDVVGAGDAVTASIAATIGDGGALKETLEIAMAASSVVIHKLGTTGTASVAEIREVLNSKREPVV